MTELRLGLLGGGASGWRALSSAKWAAASTAPGDERALDAAEKSPALARDCARLYLLKKIRGAQAGRLLKEGCQLLLSKEPDIREDLFPCPFLPSGI